MRTTSGTDWLALIMGGGTSVGAASTATATSATSLTDTTQSWTTNQWASHVVYAGAAWGVVLSNTATVLTIDRWNSPASPGGSAASTPSSTATYIIGPGSSPMWWMALTTDATAPASGDTTLPSELTTNGFARKLVTYAHTVGTSTFTLSTTVTSTQGSGSTTLAKAGYLNAQNSGTLVYETLFPATAVLQLGDTCTPTDTMTLS